jgi:hypothetical protein
MRDPEANAQQALPLDRRGAPRTTIAERYPSVEMIELSLTYVDPRSTDRARSVSLRREPKHSALFRAECPTGGCVGGGFDLDGPIHSMLRAGEHRTDGEMACQGNVGRRRNAERCGCQLSFVGWAEYREGETRRISPSL